MTKQQWRVRLLAARRARSEAERATARRRVTEHLLAGLEAPDAVRPTICAFHPLPTEPLAPDVPELLAAAGFRVLVPVARHGLALDWGEMGGPLRRGMLGVAEPTGPLLGPAAIRDAAVVLVPALAVDGDGVRLGRGGGHYDRSLALIGGAEADDSGPGMLVTAGPSTAGHGGPPGLGTAGPAGAPRLIAVVFDDEVVDLLPRDAHDVPVTEVLTPVGGLRHVAPGARSGASSN